MHLSIQVSLKIRYTMNREEALATASLYGLEAEVRYAMDVNGLDPIEALAEWDIL